MLTVKIAVQELADGLPEDATWSEVLYRIVIRQKIEEGLEDIRAGRVVSHEEVFRELEEDD
ncbi:MAG: hypothetical protein H7062_07950, partial [Candidatus Saccharimonas sp.]|nr:hypothetical protein [Planctomycetaceae bacterium]